MTKKYVLVKKLEDLIGYTENAVRCKIRQGVWLEGIHWRKAPDGRILIDYEQILKWIENQVVA